MTMQDPKGAGASTDEPHQLIEAVPENMSSRVLTRSLYKRKMEIIDYVEKNRMHSTWKEMGGSLNINRSTLQSIYHSRENIRRVVGQSSVIYPLFSTEVCRVTMSNFYHMEALLVRWVMDMREQQLAPPLEMVRWQAYVVHRMLSGVSEEPLPPHKFSPAWLRRFTKQNHLHEEPRNDETLLQDPSSDLLRLRHLLNEYAMDDIFFCDATSIFAGTVKREPVMLDRVLSMPPGQQRMAFGEWLLAFNNELERNALLLVSVAVWEQIKDKLPALALTKVQVEAVPAQLNAWLPMRTGIVRELKTHINAINFEWTKNPDSPIGNVYQAAMQEVQDSVIQQCFHQFMDVAQGSKPGDVSEELSSGQLRLMTALEKVHGNDGSNKGVYEYYLNQGSDIGPGVFLSAEIEAMLTSPDVEEFLDLGTRPGNEWWNNVVFSQ
ncbi:hypothetical protein BGW38_010649 [Lunasporangiospora selenospora]|uniref:HTH CENPB-type domain-containing protein n=1 Tax=Lunasporangiospora selenospora TaxID=979761 RepID=A0A9P6FY58_9FUNG|nr:hypothetical protein BGW38_010649 [Lunasporangiospora selenospora]